LANRIRQLARRKEMQLQTVAKRAGMTRSNLYRILGGQVEPRYRSLIALAGALGVHPGELFLDARPREGCEDVDAILDVCRRLNYDGRYRVLCYARYEESIAA
jgi:transcriptional regulator with XRE-family HTH domain